MPKPRRKRYPYVAIYEDGTKVEGKCLSAAPEGIEAFVKETQYRIVANQVVHPVKVEVL